MLTAFTHCLLLIRAQILSKLGELLAAATCASAKSNAAAAAAAAAAPTDDTERPDEVLLLAALRLMSLVSVTEHGARLLLNTAVCNWVHFSLHFFLSFFADE